MKQLGPAFDVRGDRGRCLTAACLSLGSMIGIWLLSLVALNDKNDGMYRLNAGGLILLLAVGGWMFSVVAWVRWLDWTRGRAKMKGSC